MPKADIDVYKDWLGITEKARPLNHYQLLRLKQFEDDAGKVRDNYRKMNAHVRKYAAGEYGPLSQKLLNELAKAMLCLTDARRKSEYDITLGRTAPAVEGARQTFEQMLLARKVVDSAQLGKARNFASTIGLELKDALVQQKMAPPETVMALFAESIGLPFIDLTDINVDESLVPRVPTYLARQHSCAPVMIDDNMVLMATPNPLLPDVEEELRLRIGMPVRTLLCTPAQMNECIAKYYPKEAAAAEMAAKSSAAPKAGSQQTSSPSAAAAPALTPEQIAEAKKQARQFAIIGWCLGFMVAMIGFYVMASKPTAMQGLMFAVPGGLTGAAIGYIYGKKKGSA
jgi:hypothetical protein